MTTTTPEIVNHPPHYATHPSGVECVDIAEHLSFNLGNALKYAWRAGKKHPDKHVEDLQKADWYANRELEALDAVTSHEIIQPGSEAVVRLLARKVIDKEGVDTLVSRVLREIVKTTDAGFRSDRGTEAASPESALKSISRRLGEELERLKKG